MMYLLTAQQQPVIVDVAPPPPATPSISYGGMLLSALGLVGVILLGALIVGSIIGAVIIWRRRREDATAPPTDPGHARLRI